MVPRWSRLALAAMLACGAFGASPGVGEAEAATGPRGSTCACEHDRTAAPSLVAPVVHHRFDRGTTPRQPLPLCATAPLAVAPAVVARVASVERRPVEAAPGPRLTPWRVAPKTSPPRR